MDGSDLMLGNEMVVRASRKYIVWGYDLSSSDPIKWTLTSSSSFTKKFDRFFSESRFIAEGGPSKTTPSCPWVIIIFSAEPYPNFMTIQGQEGVASRGSKRLNFRRGCGGQDVVNPTRLKEARL